MKMNWGDWGAGIVALAVFVSIIWIVAWILRIKRRDYLIRNLEAKGAIIGWESGHTVAQHFLDYPVSVAVYEELKGSENFSISDIKDISELRSIKKVELIGLKIDNATACSFSNELSAQQVLIVTDSNADGSNRGDRNPALN